MVEPRFPSIRPTSGELIHEASRRFGDKPLVVTEDERITFREAEEQSARLARALLASGAGKGTRVGLLAPNGPAFVVAWLAASRIGAPVVLLNTYHRERELARTLAHGDVHVLLTVDRFLGHDYLERLEAAAPGLAGQQHERLRVPSHPYLRSVWVWNRSGAPVPSWAAPVDALLARADDMPATMLEAVEAEVSPADPMVVVYSSGSTAEPKGVVHSHGAVVRHAHNLWRFRCLAEDDVLYNSMPQFWVGGLSYTLVAALHCGATLVFAASFDPAHILDLVERERVTQVLGWPHSGTAGGTLTPVVSGSGTTYNVAVTGMTSTGTVIASVQAGAGQDVAGNGNAISTSSDNSVMYDLTGPTVTINQAAGQADPTNTSPINFTVTFSASVTGFTNADITFSGTATTTTVNVTGGPSVYTVAVTATTDGTVIPSIPVDAASSTPARTRAKRRRAGSRSREDSSNLLRFELRSCNLLATFTS